MFRIQAKVKTGHAVSFMGSALAPERDRVSQRIWTPLDLDPPSKSASGYGPSGPNAPPTADLDPPNKTE